MLNEVEAFYDSFSSKAVDDYVYGNERIKRQFRLFSQAIPRHTRSVLVIGCGSGQGAHFIVTRVAKKAKVLAVDISSVSLGLAKALFPDKRVEYHQLDVIKDSIEGEWDVIILPDVYEHIPREGRKTLHFKLNRLLAKNGRIVFTLPSPGYQKYLYMLGTGLQPIDEIVTLEDLISLANDVEGEVTYFRMISVWLTNDYMHAVVERGAERAEPISSKDEVSIKGLPCGNLRRRVWDYLLYRLRLGQLPTHWRRWYVRRRLPGKFLRPPHKLKGES